MVSERNRRAPGTGPAPGGAPSGPGSPSLGAALRRAWLGYQRRMDEEMAAAGFSDRGFPNGRVLRLCARSEGMTASQIGRHLGITRQGAGKIVTSLRDRGFVTLGGTPRDGREKVITLTPRGRGYLEAHTDAARRIEAALRQRLGPDGSAALWSLLEALGTEEDRPRMREYLRHAFDFSAGAGDMSPTTRGGPDG